MRLTLTIILLASAFPCRAVELEAFRYIKDVQRRDAAIESILAVTLDTEVYGATRNGLPDLRTFDGQGQEVPYLLEKDTETRTRTEHEATAGKVVSLHERDNTVEVIVNLDRDARPADGLTVHTPLSNFERRIRVFGGDDGKNWTPLVENGLLFDYSRFMDVRNSEIALPKNGYRRLKIVIDAITDSRESPFVELTRKLKDGAEQERTERTTLERRPLRIDHLDFWHNIVREVGRQDKTVDYPVESFRTEVDSKEKTTLVYVRTRRQPLTELTLKTTSRNFSRAVIVERPVTRGVRTDWVEVARNRIQLIDFRGYHRDHLTLTFPEQREEEYRIVIRNEDNPPLSISGVAARGNSYRAVFLAQANAAYRVYYGAEDVQQPNYDVATVLQPLREGSDLVVATLGPQQANQTARPEPGVSSARHLLNNPFVLGTLAISLAAILGWALYHATRRIGQLPDDRTS